MFNILVFYFVKPQFYMYTHIYTFFLFYSSKMFVNIYILQEKLLQFEWTIFSLNIF